MRRFGIMGLALSAVLAAGAMYASAATAKQALVLREGGPHEYLGMDAVLAKNAPIEAIVKVSLGECTVSNPLEGNGNLRSNSSKKVGLTFERRRWQGSCEDEYEGIHDEVGADMAVLGLKQNGTVKLSEAGLAVHVSGAEYPEGCQYYFKLLRASFTVPALGAAGEAVLTATAKPFDERALAPACPRKPEPDVTITLADNGGYPLETTLEG